jgi:tungstate transport system ATP-binding protein
MNSVLEARDLRLVLKGRNIFAIDQFTLQSGEVMALVGPNGAGKSSLLLTLALLQTPTQGTILFKGQTVSRDNLFVLRRQMALVFQEALLLDTTVRRNITIALRIRGVLGHEAAVRTDRWLERFGILDLARRQARQLSGGEAQRASLARAFALEPEVLFLDEPFSSLDYPTRKVLLRDLGGVLQEMGMTAVFVTHDPTEIPYLATSVGVLHNGRIIKSGKVQEVLGTQLPGREEFQLWPD